MSGENAAGLLRVVTGGLATTVQDMGRTGAQRLGVPVSGALDTVALALANAVLGNGADEAGLECLYQGPTLRCEGAPVRLALAGAGVIEVLRANAPTAASDSASASVPTLTSVRLLPGDQARVVLRGGILAMLAVEGGLALPQVLGSRSTYARAAIGGLDGRRLAAGDLLALRRAAGDGPEHVLDAPPLSPASLVRIIPGPQDDHFPPSALEQLQASVYTVQPASDRMGLRLAGPALTHAKGFNIPSDGIPPGAIQVPGDGQPIVLLADRQTTGGYPKIATVISADLPALGRVGPGSQLRFRIVSITEAIAARRAEAARLAQLASGRRIATKGGDIDAAVLADVNLISGVTSGET